ncbi:MAG: alpha/beta hydrolase [Patescibacteria group bacterium]
MNLQSKQLIINNLLVNYYFKAGNPQTPVLLFLHGWRSEGKIWQSVMAHFSEYNIYAIDFPGFGASDIPKKDFYLQDYADIVEGFIKKNNLENIIIIGHSFGGRVGIKLSSNNPQYLKKLVLVDSAGIIIKKNNFKKIIAKLVKPIFKLPFMSPVRVKIYQSMGAEDYLATPKLKQTFVNIINENLTALLPKVKIPTLLIWGDKDRDTPLEYAHIIEQRITGSKLVVLENAGHFSFLDKEKEFINNLQNFLE